MRLSADQSKCSISQPNPSSQPSHCDSTPATLSTNTRSVIPNKKFSRGLWTSRFCLVYYLNKYFQFLNNIIYIFTYFFYLYFFSYVFKYIFSVFKYMYLIHPYLLEATFTPLSLSFSIMHNYFYIKNIYTPI